MKPEVTQRAIKVMALAHVLLEEIDELSAEGAFFKNGLKYKGKAFTAELEALTSNLYKSMKAFENKEGAEMVYYAHVKEIEKLVKSYIQE